ncbi:MAG: AarF/ABC1/UbiB kinase family protein [Flavobacteriaceae bacterium]|nr:AarF/ABC1/UbiB kinase family protein [Flavobacteriaceae bacterium]
MKSINKIPISKVQRASKLLSTGVKVGVNYAKYYGEKLVKSEEEAKANLDESNASDIYDGLKTLKGSALKVAQMLSMEKNILPRAYVEKFSLSQFSVPPLSPPLVLKTFKKYFNKTPLEVFDSFTKNGKDLAVKIQYPGVADSISSDLSLVKPIAIKMFNIRGEGSDEYFKEVENKLIEETNYELELEQSIEVAKRCHTIPNLKFPEYYPDYSSDRILTMDWMYGVHLSEFTETNKDIDKANIIGQALWDFYMYQMHVLKKVHADPHPGNFLVSDDDKLIVIDFGCMKIVPETFYVPYFELAKAENINNPVVFEEKLYELEILRKDDSKEERQFFKALFHEMLSLFTQPFHQKEFDFSDNDFFGKIADLGQKYSKSTELRKMNGNRGSKHFIYINRTFFGLYNLMHDIKATHIKIENFLQLNDKN